MREEVDGARRDAARRRLGNASTPADRGLPMDMDAPCWCAKCDKPLWPDDGLLCLFCRDELLIGFAARRRRDA